MNRIIRRTMCILLALVLMSSSAVGFTYAEYATSATATAVEARATSWGINVDVTGGAFATKYTKKDSPTSYSGIDVSVKSSTSDSIVAPGTAGTFSGLRVTGTAETAVQVDVDANLALSNWYSNANNTTYYCPLIFTINGTEIRGMDSSSSADFESKIEAAIESANGYYAPGTNFSDITALNGDYSWRWDWSGSKSQTNAKDTALAGKASVSLSVSCHVYQVD